MERIHRLDIEAVRDERLGLYVAVALVGITVAALGAGVSAIVAVAPFVAAIPLGLRRREPSELIVRVVLDSTRCVEGDRITGRIDVQIPDGFSAELLIDPDSDAVVPPDGEVWAWHIPAGAATPVGVPLVIEARRWGRAWLGRLHIRLVDAGSLLTRETSAIELPDVMVLPDARHLDELLAPAAVHAAAGAHTDRRRVADGYDFAEIREYANGDRLRDLNWRVSQRLDTPHVNRRHPERAGDVVIVLDSYPDALRGRSELSEELISRAGRATWEIAREHLAAHDRVGLAVEGARTTWLPPAAGRRARYAVLQGVLDTFTWSPSRRHEQRPVTSYHVPAAALVVAISPLARPRMLRRFVEMKASGRSVHVVALDTADLVSDLDPDVPPVVRRLAALTFQERIASLRRQGVHVVEWAPDREVARVVQRLGRVHHHAHQPQRAHR